MNVAKLLTVGNVYKQDSKDGDMYIGRPSAVGNPYVVGPLYSRHEAIERYKPWLEEKIMRRDPQVLKVIENIEHQLNQGKPVRLMCFCKPHACHGDVLREVILKRMS